MTDQIDPLTFEHLVDLAALAGFQPASVICEILKEDGSMARMPDLLEFAREHDLRIGTIEDLIRYRRRHDSILRREGETLLETRYGRFSAIVYRDTINGNAHLALVRGHIDADSVPLVRVQVHKGIPDLLQDLDKDPGWTVLTSTERLAQEQDSVLVILNYESGDPDLLEELKGRLIEKLDQEEEADDGSDPETLRTFGAGAQILADIGVRRMRVLSGSPLVMHSLAGFDLEVLEFITS